MTVKVKLFYQMKGNNVKLCIGIVKLHSQQCRGIHHYAMNNRDSTDFTGIIPEK